MIDTDERFDLWEAGNEIIMPVLTSLKETSQRQQGLRSSFNMSYTDAVDASILTWSNGGERGKITGSLPEADVFEFYLSVQWL